MKEKYVAPEIEVYEYQVEHGFAVSAVSVFLGDVENEDVTHGDDYVIGGDNSNDLWY